MGLGMSAQLPVGNQHCSGAAGATRFLTTGNLVYNGREKTEIIAAALCLVGIGGYRGA